MAEEFTHLHKSKPAIIAAGLIWGIIAWVYVQNGLHTEAEHAVRRNLLEYAELMYTGWGATAANVAAGVLSAIVDNIPVMFAVLTMNPGMSIGQWLLVTLTAGVGGSLLSIGSAAGVALMGQARGRYTFFGHLKWTPVIATGYAASILVHLTLNSKLFMG